MPQRYYGVAETARMLSVSHTTIRRYSADTPLPDYRVAPGSVRMFTAADVEALAAAVGRPSPFADTESTPAPGTALQPAQPAVDAFTALARQLQLQRAEAAEFHARVLLALWFAVGAVGIASIAVLVSALTR